MKFGCLYDRRMSLIPGTSIPEVAVVLVSSSLFRAYRNVIITSSGILQDPARLTGSTAGYT